MKQSFIMLSPGLRDIENRLSYLENTLKRVLSELSNLSSKMAPLFPILARLYTLVPDINTHNSPNMETSPNTSQPDPSELQDNDY